MPKNSQSKELFSTNRNPSQLEILKHMTDIKNLKKTKSHKSAKTPKGQRLSRKEREKQIINEAINYFSEVGFSGQTRELARRLKISQSLLFRYFPTKNAIIERVYKEVYLRRWKPEWESLIQDRQISISMRLNKFYQEYTAAIFEFEWVRMFIFSGIKGVSLYQQYLKFIHDSVLQQICIELRHEFNIDGPDQIPISQRELDLAWNFHGGIFYIAIRKFIYGTEKRDDFSDAIRDSISVFISGAETVLKDIHKLK